MTALRKLVSPLTSQFARPHGFGAAIIAPFLNRVNRRVNRAAVAALGVTAGERILEVGFGGGIGMRLVLTAIANGRLSLAVSMSHRRWCGGRSGASVTRSPRAGSRSSRGT